MTIMLTNDDGIHATGIAMLAEALKDLDDLLIAAPDTNCSCASQSATFGQSLRVRVLESCKGNQRISVEGTPADAVRYGLNKAFEIPPVLVVSGINQGPNTGLSIHHSGTVGAARQALFAGVSSVAVSLCMYEEKDNWETAKHYAKSAVILALDMERNRPNSTPPFSLNVNIPDIPLEEVKGIRYTHQSLIGYTEFPVGTEKEGSGQLFDTQAIDNGYVSITPLHIDLTDYSLLKELAIGSADNTDSAVPVKEKSNAGI